MNKEINEKIADFIKAAENKNLDNFELQGERSLSLAYPGGQIAYFKQKIFDLKREISDNSMIGHTWVINGCNYDIIETGWIQKFMPIDLNYREEPEVWNQLQIFLRQFFQLSRFEKIINDSPDPEALNPIIERERLALIFRKYKDCFNEPEDTWINRFCREGRPENPLNLDPKANEGSSRLVMLAILAAIQDNRKQDLNFNDFVRNGFGIKNFDKAKHDHKDKPEYQRILKECKAFLTE